MRNSGGVFVFDLELNLNRMMAAAAITAIINPIRHKKKKGFIKDLRERLSSGRRPMPARIRGAP
jgi:hypothetical protein